MSLAEERPADVWPDMRIADWKFLLGTDAGAEDTTIRSQIMTAIKENEMCPFYDSICIELGWEQDAALRLELHEKNRKKIDELDLAIKEASEIDSESDVRDSYQAKADYYCKIGDKEEALRALRLTNEKAVGSGAKLDIIFQQIRIGFFFADTELTKRNLEKAKVMVEEGGDWDRRNRFKVYEGLFELSIRNFEKAAKNFLDTVATFTSQELIDFNRFVTYAVLAAMLELKRNELKLKVIKCSEILEVLHSLPRLRQFIFALYECDYETYIRLLADTEQELKRDRYLSPHYRFFTREMRIKGYMQMLESYQSVRLQHMADRFGMTIEHLDREISRFIAEGRLACKIDKVNGVIVMSRPDVKSRQYQALISKGDNMLNKTQKLSRIVNA